MKRTKRINLAFMRKAATTATTATMLLSGSFLLSGCDTGQSVVFYRTIAECQQDNNASLDCQNAYANAMSEAEETAPKYNRLVDCEFDFGVGNCMTTEDGNQYMPEMSGFFIAQLSDNYYDEEGPEPLYRYRGHWVNGKGTKYGSKLSKNMNVDSDTFKSSKSSSSSRTLSRGGFGSMVASKSYSSSSGRSSFGG